MKFRYFCSDHGWVAAGESAGGHLHARHAKGSFIADILNKGVFYIRTATGVQRTDYQGVKRFLTGESSASFHSGRIR